jgi:hypothetical protein
MRMLWMASLIALGTAVLSPATPVASADCVSSAGTSLCSQGDARGADTGQGPGSLQTYPCGPEGICYPYGVTLLLDPFDHHEHHDRGRH